MHARFGESDYHMFSCIVGRSIRTEVPQIAITVGRLVDEVDVVPYNIARRLMANGKFGYRVGIGFHNDLLFEYHGALLAIDSCQRSLIGSRSGKDIIYRGLDIVFSTIDVPLIALGVDLFVDKLDRSRGIGNIVLECITEGGLWLVVFGYQHHPGGKYVAAAIAGPKGNGIGPRLLEYDLSRMLGAGPGPVPEIPLVGSGMLGEVVKVEFGGRNGATRP